VIGGAEVSGRGAGVLRAAGRGLRTLAGAFIFRGGAFFTFFRAGFLFFAGNFFAGRFLAAAFFFAFFVGFLAMLTSTSFLIG
jgi:hypothetical protein